MHYVIKIITPCELYSYDYRGMECHTVAITAAQTINGRAR